MAGSATDAIVIRREGRVGRVTLNRPAALNALTHGMCLALERALDDWRTDTGVALVLVDAAGDKAFCAGGDIAALYQAGRDGDVAALRRFWRDEYRLNASLAEYPKPVVSLMQGFVMGGGVGVGAQVRHRIVCETTRLAMPECGIGLVPDVGATRILVAAPGRLGRYVAATGARLGPADAIRAGFADGFVPKDRWPELAAALVATGDPGAIAAMAGDPGPAGLAAQQDLIDAAFAGSDVAAILARLDAAEGDFARDTAQAMRRASPLSLACALALLDLYRGGGIREALELEFRFTWRSLDGSDFLEGVRAQIIDRDRMPRWRHAGTDPTQGEVAAMLAPLAADTLQFGTEGETP